MGQQENDLNRLLREGDETSKTNKKLINAALRMAANIAEAVPNEWVGKEDMGQGIGMEYYVKLWGETRELRWIDGDRYYAFNSTSAEDILLRLARQLAGDIAKGFLTQLREKIEVYHKSTQDQLAVLEGSEANLKTDTQRDEEPAFGSQW